MTLQVEIGGEEVEGAVTLSTSDLQVALEKPYRGLRDGSHILHLALPHVRYLDRHGQPTAQALERAREILRRLYCLAR